jgi:hypothetical protein
MVIAVAFLNGCNLDEPPSSVAGFSNDLCYQNAVNNGIVFRYQNRIWLWIDDVEEGHFDISNWSLRHCQVSLGLGREFYPALIEPVYEPLSEHPANFPPNEKVILLETENVPRIYPLDLLNNHIIVNDVVDGKPVLIMYSILSDRPAVYNRQYCDTVFTFAVSGYTYWDYNILDATNEFLLWDRETESLWWPLIGEAVSGLMKGNIVDYYDEARWRVTTWQDVIENYPDALVFAEDQTMESPSNWPRYNQVECK